MTKEKDIKTGNRHDLDIIAQIGEATGEPLKKIGRKHFIGEKVFPVIATGYMTGRNRRVTGLSLSQTAAPPFHLVSRLDCLEQLILSGFSCGDLSFITPLSRLTHLFLSFIELERTDVSFKKKLPRLTQLSLMYGKLTDCSFIRDLKNLTVLNLSGNHLTDVSFVTDLKKLKALILSDNRLADVSYIAGLKDLDSLLLNDNRLTGVSFLKDMENLKYVSLDGNPFEKPPKEFIVMGNPAKIRDYFNALENAP